MNEVQGIRLSQFKDPIRTALKGYQDASNGRVKFAIHHAINLIRTTEKPNSARSESTVQYLGREVAKLYVIAFAAGDCTGDEKTYKLSDIDNQTGLFPSKPGIVPRSKATTHTESHLALASFAVDSPNADPAMFAGSLDLLSLRGKRNKLFKYATLGQSWGEFTNNMAGNKADQARTATATVGYHDGVSFTGLSPTANEVLRFGDPHAVFNPTEHIQVAAFLGIMKEDTAGFDAITALGTTIPHHRLPLQDPLEAFSE